MLNEPREVGTKMFPLGWVAGFLLITGMGRFGAGGTVSGRGDVLRVGGMARDGRRRPGIVSGSRGLWERIKSSGGKR